LDATDSGKRKLRRAGLAVSPDGYVRLTLEQFRAVTLLHVLSERDPVAPHPLTSGACGPAAVIMGITEWASQSTPALSLGWDWQLPSAGGTGGYVRVSEVRSNVMLTDAAGRDLGERATSARLDAEVDAFDWQKAVADYISKRDV
jgi:hypothetical protein